MHCLVCQKVTCSVTSSLNGPERYVSGSVSLHVFLWQAAHSCWVTSYRSPTCRLHTQALCPSAFKSAQSHPITSGQFWASFHQALTCVSSPTCDYISLPHSTNKNLAHSPGKMKKKKEEDFWDVWGIGCQSLWTKKELEMREGGPKR